ncbi:12016_t:CDS:2 [Funneliformis mosseae]|uniref:12016_t:CDS:1 n=1 Tax=Funneliformis mosseae TaxID=27381 RepID=A0A9N9EYX6_FUNMO|nr:12016_t:CDS:2 [Funneliformis mosseae]
MSLANTKATKSRPLINNPIFPWSQIKLLPNDNNFFPRYGHSSCPNAIKNELYFFGGISNEKFNNDVFLLKTKTCNIQAIKTTGNIPSPRIGHTHVRVGSNLIVFGGKLENIEDKPDYNLYVLNKETKKWTKPSIKGVTPLGRFGHTVVLIGSIMYIFGGCIDDYYLNDLVAFDTKYLDNNEAHWEFIDPANEPPPGRTGHISCAYKGKIYIFGGTDGEKCYNDTWCYDINTREWTEITCNNVIPVPRESHGSALVNDVLFIFGGRTKEGKELSDLAAYGINSMYLMGPSPTPRYWLTLSSSNHKVMIFGGDSANPSKPDKEGLIHVLDTSKIKYPIGSYPQNSSQSQSAPSRLQIVLSSFPQKKSLPKLRSQSSKKGKEIVTEINNNKKIELKARNPDIKSSSRPSSSSSFCNINVATISTREHLTRTGGIKRQLKNPLEKRDDDNNNNSRPSLIIDSKKLSVTNEKKKIQKASPQKEVKNNYKNTADISSRKQSQRTKYFENNKINESPKGGLNRQNSDRSSINPSPKPKGARMLREEKNQRKLRNFENPETSSINSSKDSSIPIKGASSVNLKEEIPDDPSPTIQITSSKDVYFQESSKPPPVRPPRRRLFSDPSSVNVKQTKRVTVTYNEEDDLIITTTPSSSIASSDGDHYPTTRFSSLERENFLERLSEADFKISELRKREKLYQAEIDLARKGGFIPTFSFNESNNDLLENMIDLNEFIDIGEPGTEKFKVIEAIIKLSHQLQKAKEAISNQERIASQKVLDFERLYDASLEETSYFKTKFTALINEYETDRLTKSANEVQEIKQQLSEKTQILEKTTKDVEDAKDKVEFIRGVFSNKINLEPNVQGNMSARFREISARCDELEALHETAHEELRATLSKYNETVKKTQGTLSTRSKSPLNSSKGSKGFEKSQQQLVDIKNRLNQVEFDYHIAVEYTTNTEQILNIMKDELMQSNLEMETLNEKLIDVESHNEKLENRLRELQDTMNSHSNVRNSILQEYADQQLEEQRKDFERERESLYQQIQDLQSKINLAKEEKNLMYQGYEALRRVYESLRRQNDSLKKSNEALKEQSLESEKKGRQLISELLKRGTELKRVEENLKPPLEEIQEEMEQHRWEQEKESLKREISQYQQTKVGLEKNNTELKRNVDETEGKIAILLDQMENVVDSYRGIEDNIREGGSPALIGPTLRN